MIKIKIYILSVHFHLNSYVINAIIKGNVVRLCHERCQMTVNEEFIKQFRAAVDGYNENGARDNIGELSEKMLHSVIKKAIATDGGELEVRINGHNIADCLKDNTVYEVQTESLFPVKKKLEFYLKNTDYDVDIVFPIPTEKYVLWVDPESGDVHSSGKRCKRRTVVDYARELNFIADYIEEPRVKLTLLYVSENEYRFLDGKRSKDKKRGSTRIERIPTDLLFGEEFCDKRDFMALLPTQDRFTRKEYMKDKKLRSARQMYSALSILLRFGFIVEDGKQRNAICYKTIISD